MWTSFLARLHTVRKQHKGSWLFLSLAAFDGASVTYISEVTMEKVLNSPASLLFFSPSQMARVVAQETLPLHRPKPHNSRRLNPFTSASCLIHGLWGDAQYRGLNIAAALVIQIVFLKNNQWLLHVFPRYSVLIQGGNEKHLHSLLYLDRNAEYFDVPIARNLQWDTVPHQISTNKDLSRKGKS